MYTDRELLCSDAQAVTAVATTNSTDVIDLSTSVDVARGRAMRLRSQVGTAFASGGAGTLRVQAVESASSTLSSPNVLADSGVLALAALASGAILIDSVIPKTTLRYIGFLYIIATAAMTGGTVTSEIVSDTESPIGTRPVGNTGL